MSWPSELVGDQLALGRLPGHRRRIRGGLAAASGVAVGQGSIAAGTSLDRGVASGGELVGAEDERLVDRKPLGSRVEVGRILERDRQERPGLVDDAP